MRRPPLSAFKSFDPPPALPPHSLISLSQTAQTLGQWQRRLHCAILGYLDADAQAHMQGLVRRTCGFQSTNSISPFIFSSSWTSSRCRTPALGAVHCLVARRPDAGLWQPRLSCWRDVDAGDPMLASTAHLAPFPTDPHLGPGDRQGDCACHQGTQAIHQRHLLAAPALVGALRDRPSFRPCSCPLTPFSRLPSKGARRSAARSLRAPPRYATAQEAASARDVGFCAGPLLTLLLRILPV